MSLFLVISWTTALTQWGMVVHAFDPCAQGAEAGRFMGSGLESEFQEKLGLHRETLSHKQQWQQ